MTMSGVFGVVLLVGQTALAQKMLCVCGSVGSKCVYGLMKLSGSIFWMALYSRQNESADLENPQ